MRTLATAGDITDERISEAIRTLIDQRAVTASICPSEVARAIGGDAWRALMPRVRDLAWRLESEGWLEVTQGGKPVSRTAKGPIRLRLRRGDASFTTEANAPVSS